MQNRKTIKKGSSDFKTIIENNGYFVDKTMFIKEFFNDSSYTLLIPRPKRFGKTLNLSMVEYFFNIQKPESVKFFSEFAISKKNDFRATHQNKYPVINISLKEIKETTWDKCIRAFINLISYLYEDFNFLLTSNKLTETEKVKFNEIKNITPAETDYKSSLESLSKFLYKHFSQKVIILVNEYDAPIISAFNNTNSPIKSPDKENKTYYENEINFMQGFTGDAFKGNNSLKKGLLTGVMRVGRESIFSGWNNFDVFGITSRYYSDTFGFTQTKKNRLLSYFKLEDKRNEIERWYDDYKLGSTKKIYNPWSIVNYIAKSKDGFISYWVNYGDYSLIKNRIIEIGVNENIQDLIEGKTIDKELHDNFVFQYFETDNELLWTLLTDNGYLTQVEESDFGNYKLKIPNNEVKIAFTNIIKTWINNEDKLKRDLLTETASNLIYNKITEFEKGFRQIIGDTLSYFDTASSPVKTVHVLSEREQIYHVYTLGLLTILSDDYIIKSNRESGQGRYDMMLIPYDKNMNGVIIEIKSIEKQKENEESKKFVKRVNTGINKALDQIEKNKYYTELIVNKIKPDNIIKLAIVFVGKEPYINRLTEK